ncbi:hydroxyacid dehydrogenase [Actinokineospora sp. HUAS TT18]|uniref:hydroxyacid dehydrogenase n=1 Tax=Actinokineospora sp. HUAS TT18 TaxID=3447451 RepID=UPI003F523D56
MTTHPRPRALFAMQPDLVGRLVPAATMARFTQLADIDPTLIATDFATPAVAAVLGEVEVIVSSWGSPKIDAAVLDAAPRLRAVIHAAGSVRYHLTEDCWDRDIQVTSAAWVNAIPVAEYTLAAILFANKQVLRLSAEYKQRQRAADWLEMDGVGNYRRTVGVVGASRIGRRVLALLAGHDFDVLLYDPYVTESEAAALGARAVPLAELCAGSDVVTVHAPELPETRHLVNRDLLGLMRDGATLINTARGSLIDQDALIDELEAGRLHAVLDVTTPDVLPADSPLYQLPNVLLTPHIAGSLGGEMHRMADAAADELARYVAGEPFAHPVVRAEFHRTA